MSGLAVHARGGRRDAYEPVGGVAGTPIVPGDAAALADRYVTDAGVRELYVADLDAIVGKIPQVAVVASLCGTGRPIWLDAGISTVERSQQALQLGVARVVVGLETLASFDDLNSICAAIGDDRVAFSLDLRDGAPIISPAARIGIAQDGETIARGAEEAGVGALIVLDLARVGSEGGLDLALIRRIRRAAPHVLLLAGGGVRGADDLSRLADTGCDGALVGTALHRGTIAAADIRAAERHVSSTR